MKIRIERSTPRNPGVIAARQRNAGPMKHVNAPKGGASNWRDLLDEENTYFLKGKSKPVELAEIEESED